MAAWIQKGFAIISDVPETMMPFLHTFCLTKGDAEAAQKGSRLPDDLMVNMRIVEAELHFDDGSEQRRNGESGAGENRH